MMRRIKRSGTGEGRLARSYRERFLEWGATTSLGLLLVLLLLSQHTCNLRILITVPTGANEGGRVEESVDCVPKHS